MFGLSDTAICVTETNAYQHAPFTGTALTLTPDKFRTSVNAIVLVCRY